MAKILAVHSFRGGTGKSSVTGNLAVTIARQGHRVGIIDCDIQSPGIHILFGLHKRALDHHLNDYLWGQCNIESAAYDVKPLLNSCYGDAVATMPDLYMIPSSGKADDIARVLREGYDVALLNDGFHRAIEQLKLEYLFIDTHPGLNEETLLSIGISDILLLLLRPDEQDFQGTAVTVDVARRLHVPQMTVVVNMALPSIDSAVLKRDIETAFGVGVAGILPLSEGIVRLASNGIFSLQEPDHPWARGISRIAENLVA